MPHKKRRSISQQNQLATVRQNRYNKENIPPARQDIVKVPTRKLSAPSSAPHYMTYEKHFRNERRQTQRLTAKNAVLAVEIRQLRSELTRVRAAATRAANSAFRASEDANLRISNLISHAHHHQKQNDTLRKTMRALKARCARAPKILKRAIQKASARPHIIKLTRHGVFTPEARALARIVVQSGCSQAKVGRVIQSIGKLLGITIKTPMSRRTVGRTILEGGVAAKIQLGYEMSRTQSKSLSVLKKSVRSP